MRRIALILIVIVAVAALVYAVFGRGMADRTATASPSTDVLATLPPVKTTGIIVADAHVVPIRHAHLSLPAAGIVKEILASEWDVVSAGTVLLRLGSTQQQATVAGAEAELQRAEARLLELRAGARSQEVEAAAAALDAARAGLAKVEQGARSAEVKAAEAAVVAAQAALQQTLAGADEQQLIAARAELAQTEAELRQAQAGYDRVSGSTNIGMRPESLRLEQATNSFEAARARLAELEKGADAADVAYARSQLRQAQADLESIQSPVRAADLDAAQAEVRRAQAQYDLAVAGSRSETLAMAEAEVAVAQAALTQAQAALAETELVAPFAGTVVSVEVEEGEQAIPSAVSVILADFSDWLIETEDLTEIDVVKIAPNDPVTLNFDALPDITLEGRILRINSLGENKQGDITYTVVIRPAQTDTHLRWNMTAVASIDTQK